MDIDDLLPPAREQPVRTLTSLTAVLPALSEAVRSALGDSPTFALRLAEATPEEREQIVTLRRALIDLVMPIRARLDALDEHARRAMVERGADQLPLTGGRVLRLEVPSASWDTKAHELRRDLLELVAAGHLTAEEVNEAVTQEVSYRVNHTRLNYLARHRGKDVEAVINAHRTRIEPDPTKGKPRWPDPKEV